MVKLAQVINAHLNGNDCIQQMWHASAMLECQWPGLSDEINSSNVLNSPVVNLVHVMFITSWYVIAERLRSDMNDTLPNQAS